SYRRRRFSRFFERDGELVDLDLERLAILERGELGLVRRELALMLGLDFGDGLGNECRHLIFGEGLSFRLSVITEAVQITALALPGLGAKFGGRLLAGREGHEFEGARAADSKFRLNEAFPSVWRPLLDCEDMSTKLGLMLVDLADQRFGLL